MFSSKKVDFKFYLKNSILKIDLHSIIFKERKDSCKFFLVLDNLNLHIVSVLGYIHTNSGDTEIHLSEEYDTDYLKDFRYIHYLNQSDYGKSWSILNQKFSKLNKSRLISQAEATARKLKH